MYGISFFSYINLFFFFMQLNLCFKCLSILNSVKLNSTLNTQNMFHICLNLLFFERSWKKKMPRIMMMKKGIKLKIVYSVPKFMISRRKKNNTTYFFHVLDKIPSNIFSANRKISSYFFIWLRFLFVTYRFLIKHNITKTSQNHYAQRTYFWWMILNVDRQQKKKQKTKHK